MWLKRRAAGCVDYAHPPSPTARHPQSGRPPWQSVSKEERSSWDGADRSGRARRFRRQQARVHSDTAEVKKSVDAGVAYGRCRTSWRGRCRTAGPPLARRILPISRARADSTMSRSEEGGNRPPPPTSHLARRRAGPTTLRAPGAVRAHLLDRLGERRKPRAIGARRWTAESGAPVVQADDETAGRRDDSRFRIWG